MTKRDIGFNHKDIDRSLRKIPGFYFVHYRNQFQTSFKFAPKFKI